MKEPKQKYKFSSKTRKRMSLAHQGKRHSPATIAKIRAGKQAYDKERATLVALELLQPFHHSVATKKLLRKIALKQKRRHKLSKKERQKGADANRYKAADKRLKLQIEKGAFQP